MCFNVGSNTAGMMNKDINLYNKAVELAKDGTLSKDDVKKLEDIAKSDGNYTGVERVFLDDLKTEDGAIIFATQAKQAGFDPKAFTWGVVEPKTSVTSAAGHKIELIFSDAPKAAKQIKGDIPEAKRTMDDLIPADKKAAWEKTDKHNVAQVKSFLDGLNLSPDNKINFISAYMTANYNHPGVDIKWNGAGLQEGINTVPSDENGRKYLDCEGYAKLAETLLAGSGSFTNLGVASGASGDIRDHQVAIQRQGDDAYVISNNEIKKVTGGATKSNEDLVKETYPDFKRVVEDKNGAMKADTANYDVGQILNTDDGANITIESIDTATKMTGVLNDSAGNNYHVKVVVDEASGNYKSIPEFKAGDKLTTDAGAVINFSGPGAAVATLPDGTTRNVTPVVNPVTGEVSFR
jgi:hypothetical protein